MGQMIALSSGVRIPAGAFLELMLPTVFERSKRAPDHDYQRIYYDIAIDWLRPWPSRLNSRIRRNAGEPILPH